MSALRVAAKTTAGENYPIKAAAEIRVHRTLESPATSAEVVFPAEKLPGALASLAISEGGKTLFEGSVDRQTATVAVSGTEVRLEARGIGALLLDNQALPGILQYVQPGAAFERFAAQYGFSFYCPNARGFLPLFTVRAGQSEWDALTAYCRRMFGKTPYVIKKQIMAERPPSGEPIVISNTGNGQKFISISHTRTPYNVISQVSLRDENGYYSSRVKNSAAAGLGQVRKRYAVPSTEFQGYPSLDANLRIRRSMLQYERVEVTLPGSFEIELGRDVQIRDRALAVSNMMVYDSTLIVSAGGIITRLGLVSSVYYD